MPVTAKLSKAFYDRLGEEVANELVDWFNLVDATYRADLRELNELNVARFDARVEQRLVSLEARLNARIDTLEARLDARIDALAAKLDTKLDSGVAEHAFAQLDAKIDRTAAQLSAQLTATFEQRFSRQVMWLLGAWALLIASIVPLWFRG